MLKLHKQNKRTKKLISFFFKFIQTELNHINNFNLFIVCILLFYNQLLIQACTGLFIF